MHRIPREPSTPRIAIWRKLRALGAVPLGDGVVALPEDARTRERDLTAKTVTAPVEDSPADVCRTLQRLRKELRIIQRRDYADCTLETIVVRGLSMTQDDRTVLALTGPLFDGLYDYYRRGLLLGMDTPT